LKYTALVPVKSLIEAKSRLALHLTPGQRAELMLDMLHHVLNVLQESQVFSHIAVVSADRYVLEQAQAWGARALIEERVGHNPALTAAANREKADGSDVLLTISADLPLLQTQDIHCMIEQSQWHDIVLATSVDGTGTNALLVRPPLVIPYLFGVNSSTRYQAEAKRRGLNYTLYKSTGLALDVDTIDDIQALERYKINHSACCSSQLIY
jgi:2-phospho-L-lactate guanylyltransferase